MKFLQIPYYAQTTVGSCGPASVMMVMKYLNKITNFNKNIEIEIWKKSILLPFRFTVAVGLAKAALNFDCSPVVWESYFHSYDKYNTLISEELKKCESINGKIDLSISDICYRNMKNYLIESGIKIKHEFLNIDKISYFINNKVPVIIMTNDGEWLHWVVVGGINENKDVVYILDPNRCGIVKIDLEKFIKKIDIFNNKKRTEALILHEI